MAGASSNEASGVLDEEILLVVPERSIGPLTRRALAGLTAGTPHDEWGLRVRRRKGVVDVARPESSTSLRVWRLVGPLDASGPLLEEVARARAEAWAQRGVGAPPGGWIDALDESAAHWVVRDDADRVVAAARFHVHDDVEEAQRHFARRVILPQVDGRVGFFSRLVVVPCARGLRLSGLADEARWREAERREVVNVLAKPGADERVQTLERLGFRVVTELEATTSPLGVAGPLLVACCRLA